MNTHTYYHQVAIAQGVTTEELHAAPSNQRPCTERPIGAKHHIRRQTRMNMNNSGICVIASIKEVLYTKARTRSLNFRPEPFGSDIVGTKECTRTFPIKGIPLTRHRPILYRFIQVMIIHRRDPAPRERHCYRSGS